MIQVSYGSILGPLLIHIFINDLFFSMQKSEVCNFADDNTLFCDKNLDIVFLNLNSDLSNVMDWFKILLELIGESSNLWSWVEIRMTVLTSM